MFASLNAQMHDNNRVCVYARIFFVCITCSLSLHKSLAAHLAEDRVHIHMHKDIRKCIQAHTQAFINTHRVPILP